MKKIYSIILGVMAFSACAIGQVVTNTMPIIAPVTVNDLPSAIMSVFHFVNFSVSPSLIIILAHLAAKYIRNYHLQDTLSHQAGVFGKLVSLIALSPLDKAEPVVAPVTK